MKIFWGKKARSDLKNIHNYISKDSIKNADMVIETLISITDNLCKMPFRYPIEPNINSKDTRFINKWNFKIIYRIFENKIFIKRVFHTKQHPKRM